MLLGRKHRVHINGRKRLGHRVFIPAATPMGLQSFGPTETQGSPPAADNPGLKATTPSV
jgi:hypothetical protein